MPLSRVRHPRCCKWKELMAQISLAILLLAAVAPARPYTHKPDNLTYYTHNSCPADKRWCGVDNGKWSKDRIIYYRYVEKDDLVIKNITSTLVAHNCSGSVSSNDCQRTHSVTNTTVGKVRNRTLVRSDEPEIIKMPDSLSLGLILTDNFNASGSLVNATYPKNLDKHWQIGIPKGCRMNIIFRVFDIESSPECKRDHFLVQTSKQQADIHKYCHHLEEIEIRNRRRVQMTLHSNEDSLQANSGIYATACISNLPDETALNQPPCTCLQSSIRTARAAKAKARSARSTLSQSQTEKYRQLRRRRIAEQDKKVSEWLHTLMKDGQPAIDEFIAHPVSIKQRLLAEQYQRAVEAAEEERMAHV